MNLNNGGRMRIIEKILFLVAILPASVSQASTNDKLAEAVVDRVVDASEWKDLIKPLEGRVPFTILNELEAATKHIAFPMVKLQKGRLVISKCNGQKITIELKEDGNVSFNGQDWEIEPLNTVDEEINRISIFLKKKSQKFSLLNFIIPFANAEEESSPKDLETLGYLTAVSWNSDNCMNGASAKQLPTCILKAYKTAIASTSERIKGQRIPYQLNCPNGQNGTLELFSKDNEGSFHRLQIKYENSNATVVSFAKSLSKGTPFKPSGDPIVLVRNGPDADNEMIGVGKKLITSVCEVHEKRVQERYKKLLEANNRSTITPNTVPQDPPNDAGSSHAI